MRNSQQCFNYIFIFISCQLGVIIVGTEQRTGPEGSGVNECMAADGYHGHTTVTRSHSQPITQSACHTVIMLYSHCAKKSFCHKVILSHDYNVTNSLCNIVIVLKSHIVTLLSYSHIHHLVTQSSCHSVIMLHSHNITNSHHNVTLYHIFILVLHF